MHSRSQSYQIQTTLEKESQTEGNRSTTYFSWKGLVFAILSATFYSVDAILAKSMKDLDPIQLSLYRFTALFCMCLPEIVNLGQNPLGPKDVRIYILLRGALGGIGIIFAYTSYNYLPLGESFIITSSLPIFAALSACLFLKEPCGIFQSILVIFTITGIIFTTKVPSRLMGNNVSYTTENVYGILAAIGVLFCRTGMVLFVRKAKKADHSVILFNYCWVSIIECLVLLPILTDFKWHGCGLQWIYILLIGVINYSSQTFLILSLKYEFAGPVTTIMAAVYIILAFLWQTIIFHDIPDYFTIIGAVIVTFCIIISAFSKWISALPENSLQRQRWRWLMV